MAEYLISVLLILGSFFILVAAIGILRFNDLFGRLHATTKATSFGILLMLIGVSIFFNLFTVYVKSMLIILFIYLTAPLAAHTIAKSFIPEKKDGDENENNIQPI